MLRQVMRYFIKKRPVFEVQIEIIMRVDLD